MVTIVFVVILVAALSYANGANDNSKGVATLVGFGTATPRQALLWATITTAIGAGFSFVFASGMIAAFKSKLFVPGTPLATTFFIAVLVGAIGWITFTTYSGLPVSTTHAIVGGLIGAGVSHRIMYWALATSLPRNRTVPHACMILRHHPHHARRHAQQQRQGGKEREEPATHHIMIPCATSVSRSCRDLNSRGLKESSSSPSNEVVEEQN